jgi:hypothetical protein
LLGHRNLQRCALGCTRGSNRSAKLTPTAMQWSQRGSPPSEKLGGPRLSAANLRQEARQLYLIREVGPCNCDTPLRSRRPFCPSHTAQKYQGDLPQRLVTQAHRARECRKDVSGQTSKTIQCGDDDCSGLLAGQSEHLEALKALSAESRRLAPL